MTLNLLKNGNFRSSQYVQLQFQHLGGRSRVQYHLWLYSKFDTNLSYKNCSQNTPIEQRWYLNYLISVVPGTRPGTWRKLTQVIFPFKGYWNFFEFKETKWIYFVLMTWVSKT